MNRTKEITVHKDDTIALEATLPRELSNVSNVSFLFTKDEEEYSAVIKDVSSGDVAVPLSSFDPDIGLWDIKWKLTYNDNTVEVLPPDGDKLKVV